MNERATGIILRYLECQNLDLSEEAVFSRWAATEMIHDILDHPFGLETDVLEAFCLRMDVYSILTDSRPAGRIFMIAAQTAREILDIIEKGEKT